MAALRMYSLMGKVQADDSSSSSSKKTTQSAEVSTSSRCDGAGFWLRNMVCSSDFGGPIKGWGAPVTAQALLWVKRLTASA